MPVPKAVIIGTDEFWAPPRTMYFDFGDLFIIRNVSTATWPIAEDGLVTRCAISIRNGEWGKIGIPPIQAHGGGTITIPVGTIQITVELETYNEIPKLSDMVKSALRKGVFIENWSLLNP